jgi:hypothetical protein
LIGLISTEEEVMADNLKNRGRADRARVSKQRHELDYLKRKFSISGQAAAGAQRAAGPSRKKVEAYIKASSGR